MARCLFVTSRSSVETAGRIELFLAQSLPSADPTLRYKGIRVSSEITALASATLSQTLNVADVSSFFSPTAGQSSHRSSTDDRLQFITLSVHLCLQRVKRGAQRRAVSLRQLRLV